MNASAQILRVKIDLPVNNLKFWKNQIHRGTDWLRFYKFKSICDFLCNQTVKILRMASILI